MDEEVGKSHKQSKLKKIIASVFVGLMIYVGVKHTQKSKSGFNLIKESKNVDVRFENKVFENGISCLKGSSFTTNIMISNYSKFPLISGLEANRKVSAVNLGHRFVTKNSTAQEGADHAWEGPRYFFRNTVKTINEDGSYIAMLRITCPKKVGEYYLNVELVQEGVAWQSNTSAKDNYIDKIPVTSYNLFEDIEQFPLTRVSKNFKDFLANQNVNKKIKQVAVAAYRLLDHSQISLNKNGAHYVLIEAGTQYPMVWVRDLANIQKAFHIVYPRAAKRTHHWIELFFEKQSQGEIPDWIALDKPWMGLTEDKNTISIDQELWALEAVLDDLDNGSLSFDWLNKKTNEKRNIDRLEEALTWTMQQRFDDREGCLWNGHTVDWGDVGILGDDNFTATKMMFSAGQICGTFNQTLFLKVGQKFLTLGPQLSVAFKHQLEQKIARVSEYLWNHLWDDNVGYFRIHRHITLESDIEDRTNCDENNPFALGAQVMAWEAGLLQTNHITRISMNILKLQKKFKMSTVSGVLLPPYGKGVYKHPSLREPFVYQNGGQWDWFGPRAALMISMFDKKAGELKLLEIAEKILKNKNFYEWDKPDGSPGGGEGYKASAASFLSSAVKLYQANQLSLK